MDDKKTAQAVQWLKSGEFEKALKQFNALIEKDSTSADLYSYRGAVLLNLKRKNEALEDFNRSVELDPDYSYRYAARAFAKDALGDLSGAIADYEIAIKLDPDDAIAHNNLGLLIEKSGNQAKAKKHFATADDLAKHFFGEDADSAQPRPEDGVKLTPSKLTPDPKELSTKMFWQEFTAVFTSRREFSRFISFVKNGFKREDA